MATKSQIAEWLRWADNQLKSNGGNSKPSNWDKATAPIIISQYKTWQEVYDNVLQDYLDAGATDQEVAVAAPNKAKSNAAKKKKEDAAALDAARATDPFGTDAVSKYGLAVDVDVNGQQTVKGMEPGSQTAVPMYVYTSKSSTYSTSPELVNGKPVTSSKGGDLDVYVSSDYNSIRERILKDAQLQPGGMDALFNKFYSSGVISKQTFDTKNISAADFAKGMQYLVNQYSIKAINDYKITGNKNVGTFNDFLSSEFKPDKGQSTTRYSMVQTTRQDAATDADQFFMTYLGRSATKAEHDEYYKALHSAELKAVHYTTTDSDGNVVSKGQNLNDTDRALILGKVAGSAIKGTDIATLMKSGGQASIDVDSIMAYGAEYGVRISREQAMSYVANNLKAGQNLASTKSKIVEIAKSHYKTLSDKISDNLSVRELAGNYIYQKADKLELNPQTIDLFDGDIQDAINGNMSMTDFNVKLRQNAAWANTKNAKEEAAHYATSILQSFGLMA